MLKIMLDQPVTRRLRRHVIIAEDGSEVWSASRFSGIVEWLYDHDVREALIFSENLCFVMQVWRTAEPEERPTWQS